MAELVRADERLKREFPLITLPVLILHGTADKVTIRRPGDLGLPRRTLASVLSAWPSAGFHKRLVRLELQRLRTYPWNPLPMLRL